jgi:hypothetical protein
MADAAGGVLDGTGEEGLNAAGEAGDVVLDLAGIGGLALDETAGGVTDPAGCAAYEGDDGVAAEVEVEEGHEGEQVADVQGTGSGIDTGVHAPRPGEGGMQGVAVGDVVHEATMGQVIEESDRGDVVAAGMSRGSNDCSEHDGHGET